MQDTVSSFLPVSFWISLTFACSSCEQNVSATPERPARPGSADTMDIGLGRIGQIVVDNGMELADVDAPCGDVRWPP